MENAHLLENESIIIESSPKQVVLTNLRLRIETGTNNEKKVSSVFLEKISTIRTEHQTYPWMLLVGGLSAIGGIAMSSVENSLDYFYLGAVLGIVFFLIYYFTRKSIFAIYAEDGSKLTFIWKNVKTMSTLDILNKIERAIYERRSKM